MSSWFLEDGSEMARASPYTFYKPSEEAILRLRPGDGCKLAFLFGSDPEEPSSGERMWVKISKVDYPVFEGTLDNEPCSSSAISLGDPLTFSANHIIRLSIEDVDALAFNRFFLRCLVTRRVLEDGVPTRYIYRQEPIEEEDSGWRIIEGTEPSEYLDDLSNYSRVAIGKMLNRDDSFFSLIDKPVGSCFYRVSEVEEWEACDE